MAKHGKLNSITHAARQLQSQNAFQERLTKQKSIPNNSWDDVEKLSNFCGQLLLAGAGLLPALKNPAILEQVSDIGALNQLTQILSRDSLQFSNQLINLRSQHVGKKGNAETPDENMLAINLYSEYGLFSEQFEAIVQPTIMHIVEIIQQAEAKLRDIDNDTADMIGAQTSVVLDAALDRKPVETAKDDAALTTKQDPSVITDVVVKSKPTE